MAAPAQFADEHYDHSRPVPNREMDEYKFITLIPVRRSNSWQCLDDVMNGLVHDWSITIGTHEYNPDYYGSENAISGCFDALTMPESKPERLKINLWFTQFVFLLDGMCQPRALTWIPLPFMTLIQTRLSAWLARLYVEFSGTTYTIKSASLQSPPIRLSLHLPSPTHYIHLHPS
jgi:hypothetical protein